MRATLQKVERHTADVSTYWFQPEHAYDFIAGQYCDMRIAHANADSRGDTRIMSFASSPTEPLLAITTRFAAEGSSFKKAFRELKVGDKVDLSEPLGDFVLPKDSTIPLVFIAGGIGIAPVRSIIRYLLDKQETDRDITILYGTRDEENMIFKQLLATCSWLTFVPFIGKRIALADILKISEKKPNALLFLSGTENMVYTLNDQLQHAGISRSQIVLESFDGYDR